MEVHDHRRRSPHEEPPLQTDASSEYALHRTTPSATDRHAVAEQAAWALGVAKLLATFNIQELLHFRAVVQRSVRYNWRKGESDLRVLLRVLLLKHF